MRRLQATGILRQAADVAVWCACGQAAQRKLALAQLVEAGLLTPMLIGQLKTPYYIPTKALDLLDRPPAEPRMIFLGPLDSLLWDRKALWHIFQFDYVWEVYKPLEQRKWGYYVLPVFYGDRFVARVDMRLEKSILTIARWWWEPAITPDAASLDASRTADARFLHNLRASAICVGEEVDKAVRDALQSV